MTATADVLYLDSNVVFYSVISDREFGESCARILREVDDGSIRVAASVLVIAEVANAIRKIGRVREMERVTSALTSLPIRFHDLSESLAVEGVGLGKSIGISPYDGVHAATMAAAGIRSIISADKDFDKVPGIVRVDPRAHAESVGA